MKDINMFMGDEMRRTLCKKKYHSIKCPLSIIKKFR